MKIKESDLPVLSSRYEVDLKNVRARKQEKQTDKMYEEFTDFGRADSELTWDTVATVFDRLWFLLFLIIKIVFNGLLLGNLFHETKTGIE